MNASNSRRVQCTPAKRAGAGREARVEGMNLQTSSAWEE